MMTIKKLLLTLSIILSCGLIMGGIVNAQDAPKPKAEPKAKAQADADYDFDFDFDFPEPNLYAPQDDRNFTFFFSGGTFLGVHVEDVSKENMSRYGMRDVRGVGVTQVVKDSPAEKAGLRKDDVSCALTANQSPAQEAQRLVSESSPDQNVRVTISAADRNKSSRLPLRTKRDDQIFNSKLGDTLFKIDKNNFPKIKGGDGNFVFSLGMHRRMGVSTQPLSKQLAEYFGVTEGILVTSVTENSPAAKAGLKAGDVITAVDGEKVDSPGDVSRIINKKQEGSVSLTVVRDRNTRTITVTPEKQKINTGDLRRILTPRIEIPVVPNINVQVPRLSCR